MPRRSLRIKAKASHIANTVSHTNIVSKVDSSTNTNDLHSQLMEFKEELDKYQHNGGVLKLREIMKNNWSTLMRTHEELIDMKKNFLSINDPKIDNSIFTIENTAMGQAENLKKKFLEMKSCVQERFKDLMSMTAIIEDKFQTSTQVKDNLTKLLEIEFQCAICKEIFVEAVVINCSHTFCKYCLNQWKTRCKRCPICSSLIAADTNNLVINSFLTNMVPLANTSVKEHWLQLLKSRKAQDPEESAKKRKFDDSLSNLSSAISSQVRALRPRNPDSGSSSSTGLSSNEFIEIVDMTGDA